MVPWNAYALRKVWNNEIKVWAAPWWAENSKEAYASGVAALASALDNFSKSRRGVLRGRPVGFPRHKRKTSRRSFTVSTGCFGVADARHVRLPVIGVVRTKEPTVKLAALLDAGGARVLAATVSETAGRWFVSLRVEMASPAAKHRPDPRRVAGVDLGVKTLATVVTLTEHADGTTTETVEAVPNPKPLGRWQRKLARQARQMARRQPGSRRRAQTAASLARTHHKVRQRTARQPAQAHQPPGHHGRHRRRRGPECGRHGQKPPPGPRHLRRWLLRSPPPAHLQDRLGRRDPGGGRPVLPVIQVVLSLLDSESQTVPGRAHLHLRALRARR